MKLSRNRRGYEEDEYNDEVEPVETQKKRGIEEDTVKKVVKYTMIGAIVLAVLITFIFNRPSSVDPDEDVIEDVPEREVQIEDDRDKILETKKAEEVEETPIDESTEDGRMKSNWKKAKDELERTGEPVQGSEEHLNALAGKMVEMIDYLAQDLKGREGDFTSSVEFANSIVGQTDGWIADNVNTALSVNYHLAPETAEWFYSDTDGIYQFAVSIKSDEPDKEDIVLSGNYNVEAAKFKIFNISGNLNFPELST